MIYLHYHFIPVLFSLSCVLMQVFVPFTDDSCSVGADVHLSTEAVAGGSTDHQAGVSVEQTPAFPVRAAD